MVAAVRFVHDLSRILAELVVLGRLQLQHIVSVALQSRPEDRAVVARSLDLPQIPGLFGDGQLACRRFIEVRRGRFVRRVLHLVRRRFAVQAEHRAGQRLIVLLPQLEDLDIPDLPDVYRAQNGLRFGEIAEGVVVRADPVERVEGILLIAGKLDDRVLGLDGPDPILIRFGKRPVLNLPALLLLQNQRFGRAAARRNRPLGDQELPRSERGLQIALRPVVRQLERLALADQEAEADVLRSLIRFAAAVLQFLDESRHVCDPHADLLRRRLQLGIHADEVIAVAEAVPGGQAPPGGSVDLRIKTD